TVADAEARYRGCEQIILGTLVEDSGSVTESVFVPRDDEHMLVVGDKLGSGAVLRSVVSQALCAGWRVFAVDTDRVLSGVDGLPGVSYIGRPRRLLDTEQSVAAVKMVSDVVSERMAAFADGTAVSPQAPVLLVLSGVDEMLRVWDVELVVGDRGRVNGLLDAVMRTGPDFGVHTVISSQDMRAASIPSGYASRAGVVVCSGRPDGMTVTKMTDWTSLALVRTVDAMTFGDGDGLVAHRRGGQVQQVKLNLAESPMTLPVAVPDLHLKRIIAPGFPMLDAPSVDVQPAADQTDTPVGSEDAWGSVGPHDSWDGFELVLGRGERTAVVARPAQNPITVVVGPTGSGKSEALITIAEQCRAAGWRLAVAADQSHGLAEAYCGVDGVLGADLGVADVIGHVWSVLRGRRLSARGDKDVTGEVSDPPVALVVDDQDMRALPAPSRRRLAEIAALGRELRITVFLATQRLVLVPQEVRPHVSVVVALPGAGKGDVPTSEAMQLLQQLRSRGQSARRAAVCVFDARKQTWRTDECQLFLTPHPVPAG
ncbi:MAG: hypothetical protein WAV90_13870, partial [Gordonia amarae]